MAKLPQAPKSNKKFWGIVLGIPLAFVLAIVFMFVYQGSTKDIVAAADQLQPGDGWKLESEQAEPPRIVCLNSVPCPSIGKRWSIKRDVSKSDFEDILSQTKWQFVVSGDCNPAENISGTKGSVCHAQVVADNMSIDIRLAKSISDPNETDLILDIR